MRKIDLESWVRRPLYENFKTYPDPYFNLTAEVDITGLRQLVDARQLSFFAASYFLVLKAVNEIEEFRLRIQDGDVVLHDIVHGSCTVLNADATFSFCFFHYHEEFGKFEKNCARILEENERRPSFEPRFERDDVIHSSIIPWVRFTSFEHAKRLGSGDSCPKVVLGKFVAENGRIMMPISVSAHHALMDGVHAALFFEKYEEFSRNSEIIFNI
jgi:chloramphenicol O-acetyltransferase type A